ncbi:MAG TPA: zinc-binding dehydrogenase [Saprospiraceae bacterium]|nr:alcohol dehydrogenase [Saprospirales bacterium]HRQ28707.1 zinc-binding dehydrogenase [Saprospiraceae bacterium]
MKALVLKSKGVWPSLEDIELEHSSDFCYPELLNSSLNRRDYWIVQGLYPGIRYPMVLGSDGVGMLESRRVLFNPSFSWGDQEAYQAKDYHILGLPTRGTFAEVLQIPISNVFDVPDHLTNEEAAALPLAGLTAYRALFIKASPNPGEKVFITGIGGGVALFVMQFALAKGLKVYVSSGSDAKIQKAIEAGASGGVNYNSSAWKNSLSEMEPEGFDVVVDGTGGSGLASLISVCKPGARVVIYGGTAGKIPEINPQHLFWKQIQIIGTTMGSESDFKQMLAFVKKHQIRPVIDSVYPLSEAAKAFERMASSVQFGKMVFDNRN